MADKMKYVLLELPESEDMAARLNDLGLRSTFLGFESKETSAKMFAAAPQLYEALSLLYSFCNASTRIYTSIPETFLEKVETALASASAK